MNDKAQLKVPVLYYREPEDGEEQDSLDVFPYIEVQANEDFPRALFIQEWRTTGEFEPTDEGDMPIVERDIKLFINCDVLKDVLSEDTFDLVKTRAGFPSKRKKV